MTFEISIDIILYEPYSQHGREKKKIESFIIAIEQMGKMRCSGIISDFKIYNLKVKQHEISRK